MDVGEFVTENTRTLVLVGLGVVAYFEFTAAEWPTIPAWGGLVWAAGFAIAIGAYYAAGKIYALWPEDPRLYFQVHDATRPTAQQIRGEWSVTPDEWEDWSVTGGTLVEQQEVSVNGKLYLCTGFDEENKTVTTSWKHGSDPGEWDGYTHVEDVETRIAELENDLTPRARFGDWFRRNTKGVIRALDRRRAREQNAALDPNLTPSFGDGDSLDDVLREQMPEDVLPTHLKAEDATQDADEQEQSKRERVMEVAADLAGLAGADVYTNEKYNDDE